MAVPELALELIHRARQGDPAAFRQLYERYAGRVLNFSYRLLGNREEAEEVTQETFLSVHRHLGGLKDGTRFEPWLFMIARNFVYQLFRRRRAVTVSIDDDNREDHPVPVLAATGGTPQDAAWSGEIRERTRQAIQALPLKYREVFVLAVIEGYSYKEVAEITGRRVQSIKTDIHRARLRLRDALAPYVEGEGRQT